MIEKARKQPDMCIQKNLKAIILLNQNSFSALIVWPVAEAFVLMFILVSAWADFPCC